MSDNAGNKIEGENEGNSEYAIRKETESRFPTPEALCYLVPSVKRECFGKLPNEYADRVYYWILLGCKRSDDLFETGIATERVPPRH